VSLPPSPTLTGYASFCAMEDCVGEGGYAKCTKPKKAPANSRTDAESDEEKWSYQMCDWGLVTSGGGICSQYASWCQAAGGTVSGANNCECSGLPGWVINNTPTFSRSEQPVLPTSNAYAALRLGSSLCSPIVSTDTGWAGLTNTDDLVCGGSITQKNGINISEPRRIIYNTTLGPSCTPRYVQLTLNRQRSLACDFGYLARTKPNGDMQCYKPVENVCTTANPVVPTYGAKQHEQTDFSGSHGLRFVWRYRSDGYYRDKSEPIGAVSPKDVWRHNWQRNLWAQTAGSGMLAVLRLGGGEVLYFDEQGNAIHNRDGGKERLVKLTTGWQYFSAHDEIEDYDIGGHLVGVTQRDGKRISLVYDAQSRLQSIADSFGRSLQLTYNVNGNVGSMTDPVGTSSLYAYDTQGMLQSTTHASATSSASTVFLYESPGNRILLTGIVDENNSRFSTYSYVNDKVDVTEHAGGVNRFKYTYSFPDVSEMYTQIAGPNSWSETRRYKNIAGVLRQSQAAGACNSCGTGANQRSTTSFDSSGNVATRLDGLNIATCYENDPARNLELRRIEGLSTNSMSCATALSSSAESLPAPARTITTVWHPTYRLPTKMTESVTGGNRVTDYTYDASGNMLTRKVTAPKNDGSGTNEIRTWTYTYNALGQVLTAKDPLNKTTTTVYYAATDTATPPQYTKGDVQTITNAVGHVTTMNAYDKNGRPTQMTDANGLITTMTYHPRGWLTSRAVNNGAVTETTTYSYDNVGQLTRVTMPDGSNLFYAYDAAHRLVGMSDQQTGASVAGNGALIFTSSNLAGNKITYTLDTMGNRIKEQHFDPTGTLAKQKQRAIDALNRLKQDIGGTAYAAAAPAGAPAIDATATANGAPTNASITQYSYDNNGNVTTSTDPLGRSTTNQYDALNRLTKVIDPYNGAAKPTIYQYDTANNLTSVTDPEGKATVYTYNGHNNLIVQQSPDTGSTKFKYNVMGNVVAKIDSVNRCSTTAYDNLHRATSIKYYAAANAATNTQALCFGTIAGTVTPEETHTYTYDSITATLGGPGGKGRISRIADGTGRIDYVYDKNGRITSKTQVVTGAAGSPAVINPNRVITYAYNAFGQLASSTTPSGQTINYSYGAPSSSNPGKLIGMNLNGTINILTNADYKPFGPNEGWDWGNSGASLTSTPPINQHARFFDLDYRPTTIGNDPEGYTRNIAWDRANRITGITVPTTGTGSLVPGLANGQSLNQAFAYDTLDRLTQFNAGVNGATTAATGLALLPAETFTYDGIGNRKSRTTQAPNSSTTQSTSYAHANASPANHWLTSATGQLPNAYTYDASGNTLTETNALAAMNPTTGQMNATTGTPITSALAYTYDAKNRLTKVQIGATTTDTVTYKINAMGQRVQKIGAGLYAPSTTATINTTTGQSPQGISLNFNARFVYDEQGRIIGEYANDGKLIAETIWFNDLPIATLRPKGSNNQIPLGTPGTTATQANNVGNNTTANKVNVDIYYVHPDHLGTPRVVTRSAAIGAATTGPNAINKQVWRANTDPFGSALGNSQPNENPQLVTGTAAVVQAATFRQNLRNPGQIADAETGKIDNWNRIYDSTGGRYTQSDPVGIFAGKNTYSYVFNRPNLLVDPDGAQATIGWGRVGGFCAAAAVADGPLPFGEVACACVAAGFGIYVLSQSGNGDGSNKPILAPPTTASCSDPENCGKDPCKGIRKQLQVHQQKLLQYVNNPLACDNRGTLSMGMMCGDMGIADGGMQAGRVYNTRITEIKKQIEMWKRELEKCEEKNGK
jgi:RHS repeat-associated protein